VIGYEGNALAVEGVRLEAIAASVGTPCYVYSAGLITAAWRAYAEAFAGVPHLVCFAVKANSNRALLELLARAGAGFDIVSGGELERVRAAGGAAGKVVFAGVGKSAVEIEQALGAGVRHVNCESLAELERIAAVAERLGCRARVGLRLNPEVDPGTHPYIATGLKEAKFGLPAADLDRARALLRASPQLELVSLGCHIGSQLTQVAPVADAVGRVALLIDQWRAEGFAVESIDVGGGLGISYRGEPVPSIAEYAGAVLAAIGGRELEVLIEPGRSLVGPAGVLLTRVEYIKHGERRNFAVVDAAMNDLLRPALYDAWHEVQPVRRDGPAPAIRCDVVGPVCETGDFLARDRELAVAAGDLLALRDAGAYGFTMSSNYNSRPRPPEVLVRGDEFALVRERERVAALTLGERGLPPGW